MIGTEVSTFRSTIEATTEWLKELNAELQRDNPDQLFRMLRAVLTALRDRVTLEEATDLGAQLPLLIRGAYYEGWNPSKTPTRQRDLQSFLNRVAEGLVPATDGDPEQVTRAVFKVLQKHVTAGEIGDVRSNLPKDLQPLWP